VTIRVFHKLSHLGHLPPGFMPKTNITRQRSNTRPPKMAAASFIANITTGPPMYRKNYERTVSIRIKGILSIYWIRVIINLGVL